MNVTKIISSHSSNLNYWWYLWVIQPQLKNVYLFNGYSIVRNDITPFPFLANSESGKWNLQQLQGCSASVASASIINSEIIIWIWLFAAPPISGPLWCYFRFPVMQGPVSQRITCSGRFYHSTELDVPYFVAKSQAELRRLLLLCSVLCDILF